MMHRFITTGLPTVAALALACTGLAGPIPIVGGGSGAVGGGTNAVGGGTNAVGGGTNAVGGGTNATGGGTNATGGGTNATGGGTASANRPFDWVGVIGTGQSLSVGWFSTAISTTQPFQNLKLIDTGPDPKYPLDGSTTARWSVVPLTEPFREWVAGTGPGYDDYQYPNNVYADSAGAHGESQQSGMGNTISQLWHDRGEPGTYVTAHSLVGWAGHCLVDIDHGSRAYKAALAETRAFKQLADAAGKTYGVAAILLTHGECDATNPSYGAAVYQMLNSYNSDLKAITGQTTDAVLLVSQASTLPTGYSGSAVQVWQQGISHPGEVICTGPKYQVPGDLHLPETGYERLGEKAGEVFDQVVNLKRAWKPLGPNHVSRRGAVITIDFDVPNPPLQWDPLVSVHQTAHTAWANGEGFEVMDANNNELTIASAAIAGNSVVLTLASAPAAGTSLTVAYALTGDTGNYHALNGALRDSDPFVGYHNQTLSVMVTQGSSTVTAPQEMLTHIGEGDIVTGTGLGNDTVVTHRNFSTLTLSKPWPGATGTASLGFRHDHRNYCVQFALPVP